jgi:hypothetical protein
MHACSWHAVLLDCVWRLSCLGTGDGGCGVSSACTLMQNVLHATTYHNMHAAAPCWRWRRQRSAGSATSWRSTWSKQQVGLGEGLLTGPLLLAPNPESAGSSQHACNSHHTSQPPNHDHHARMRPAESHAAALQPLIEGLRSDVAALTDALDGHRSAAAAAAAELAGARERAGGLEGEVGALRRDHKAEGNRLLGVQVRPWAAAAPAGGRTGEAVVWAIGGCMSLLLLPVSVPTGPGVCMCFTCRHH